MSRVLNNIIKYLNKNHIYMVLVLVILFIIPIKVNAVSNKDYSKFNWDTFYEKNKNYWTDMCKKESEEEECHDTILYYQEKYYKKLYQLLAAYQMKGLYISDDVIITTTFFELFPGYGGNPNQEVHYKTIYQKGGETGARAAIKLDDDYSADVEVEDEGSMQNKANEMNNEDDTIKLLLNNAIAYYTYCYGIYGDPVTDSAGDGSSYKQCPEGSQMTKVINKKLGINTETCAVNLSATSQGPGNELVYADYFVSKVAHGLNSDFYAQVLGTYKEDDYYLDCEARKDSYPGGTVYTYVDQANRADPHVSYKKYFDFLKTSRYFDNRLHLQGHFEDVLDAANVDCLTSSLCTNSLEAKGDYDLYEEMLEKDRLKIIASIISILNYQGMDIEYEGYGTTSYSSVETTTAERSSYYWPIGSEEITEENGVKFAKGTPTKVLSDIESYYGNRKNPITKVSELHYGIDISTVDGVTNIVAAYNGVVASIVSNCTVGDYTILCGMVKSWITKLKN